MVSAPRPGPEIGRSGHTRKWSPATLPKVEKAFDPRALLARQDGFLFLPLVYRLAARLEGLNWAGFSADPRVSAHALSSAQARFALPVMAGHFRIGVEAEACGADLGRDDEGDWGDEQPVRLADPSLLGGEALDRAPLAQVLEATRLLAEAITPRGATTLGVLTGPRTLASLFEGLPQAPDRFYGALAEAYAKNGAGALLVVEDGSPILEDDPAIFDPLVVVARYYRLPLILMDAAAQEPPHGFTLHVGPSRMLPLEALLTPPDEPAHWPARHAPLLMTEWEVPAEVEPEDLDGWLKALNGDAAPRLAQSPTERR